MKWKISAQPSDTQPVSDPLNNTYALASLVAGWLSCSLRGVDDYDTEPDPALLQYLFGDDGPMNGVINPAYFFGAANGWNFEFFIMWDESGPPHNG